MPNDSGGIGADAARDRLAAIVESSDDAIIGTDLNGIVTSWNNAAETLFGYAAHEIAGQSVTRLLPRSLTAERIEAEAAMFDRIRRGEKIAPFETRRRRKDGVIVAISLGVSPVYDTAGALIGFAEIARAIGESQRRAAEVNHAARLSELANSLSMLAREANQPLAAIGNYLTAARRLILTGDQAGAEMAVQRVAEQAERTREIIRRLPDLIREGGTGRRPNQAGSGDGAGGDSVDD
jgi:PAS domain S-box-containing protein